jgi:ribonucleoside-diphosphate reductase alpha chain
VPSQLITYEQFQALVKGLIKTPITLTEHARSIYSERYCKRLANGSIESIEERLAACAVDIASAEMEYAPGSPKEKLAAVEKLAKQIYAGMIDKQFLFNTPTLMNFGRFKKSGSDHIQENQMGSACFVLPIADTFGDENPGDGILDQIKHQGLIHKSGGGTGFSFARLRPSGSIIGYDKEIHKDKSIDWDSSTGITSGPLSFLKYLYDQETNAIKQGNSRRGANMGVQRIDHPDFLDHLYAKFGSRDSDGESLIVNFNLSFAITDEFMKAARDNKYFRLVNPHNGRPVPGQDICSQSRFEEILKSNRVNPYNPLTVPSLYMKTNSSDIVNGYTGQIIGFDDGDCIKINARMILHEIARIAASNGEPGLIFIDRMNEYNPTPDIGPIEATNPCGEQPLLPYEACNLASINLSRFVVYDKKENPSLDFESMKKTISLVVRSLDNVIDRSDFPLKKITNAVTTTRKIGLGVMGFADMLYKLGIPYDSSESVELSEKIAEFLYIEGRKASVELAEEKGTFPAYTGSIYDSESPNFLAGRIMDYNCKPRNSTVTTIAPTGTISRLNETSSGIEPTFSLVYRSKIMNKVMDNVSHGFVELAKKKGFYSDGLMKAVRDNGGTLGITDQTPSDIVDAIQSIPEEFRDVLQTSAGGQISSQCHIDIQAAFQKYNDSSISKTVILPSGSGVEDVLSTYFSAWTKGLKGITIYIDKSRSIQVLNTTDMRQNRATDKPPYQRPLVQESITVELPIGDPLKKPGEFEEKSEVVFTTLAFDRSSRRVNSIFQNMSFGSSHELIYLIAQNKAWSRLLKMSGGDLAQLERELRGLPRAHHEGTISEDGTMKTRISNDTIPNAALKTVWFIKYMTESYTNWEVSSMNKRYRDYHNGKVMLKDIIKFEGDVKFDNEAGLPSILPKSDVLIVNNSVLKPKMCPYCKREDPPFHLEEKCIMYDCCGQSKCS